MTQRWTTTWAGQYVPMQYDVRDDPWKMIVTCIMLRMTTGDVAKPVLERFFERWPEPRDLYEATDADEIVQVIRPCGLYNMRLIALVDLATEYLGYIRTFPRLPTWRDVRRWPNAGDYLVQSYMIFIDFEDPRDHGYTVADHVLKDWLESPLWDLYRTVRSLPVIQPSEETAHATSIE